MNVAHTDVAKDEYDELRRIDGALEEIIRRARLQAGELSLLTQRLERLRRDIQEHLQVGVR